MTSTTLGVTEAEENSTMNFYQDEDDPILNEYHFQLNNPFLSNPTFTLLATAKSLLMSPSSSLPEISLMLEGAIRQGDLGRHGWEAWLLLGEVETMNERPEQGLSALQFAMRIAESESGALAEDDLMLKLLMTLATAYANESFQSAARRTLKKWFCLRFPQHVPPPSPWRNVNPWSLHMELMEGFLRAARETHSKGASDPDVQIGLGILNYMNSEYRRAVECFECALSLRPTDFTLWNALGSCLLNDSRTEEALVAYQRALRLRPGYIRATCNVGLACLELGAPKEAAEHFLAALSLQCQAQTKDVTVERSDSIVSMLTRAFGAMDRPDLTDILKESSDIEIFKKFGFEF
jgi:peroxin-5